MKKRIVAAALCLCVILGMTQSTIAVANSVNNGSPQARWINTSSIVLSMSLSNGKVSWVGQIQGQPGTTKIVATYVLEKKKSNDEYEEVGRWPNLTAYSSILTSSGSVTGTSGTYRLTVTATVTRNGSDEVVTDNLVKPL